MEVTANGVKGDERVEWELSREVEAKFWVEKYRREDVEVWRVGARIDVSWRREDEAGAFAFSACGEGFLNTVGRG